MSKMFLEVARDPRIIPGVHHYCDEWCAQCPVTARCLAFRCTAIYRKTKGRTGPEPSFDTPQEMIDFTRNLAAAEGMGTPEPDAIIAAGATGFRTRDPLAHAALEYALALSMWLVVSPEDLQRLRRGAAPSAEEILLWLHLRIYMKLTRALVTRERVASGQSTRNEEAIGCARLVLVSVQRSRRALQQLETPATANTVRPLIALLDVLERGIDERFPTARSFVRVGLDVPAG